MGHLEFNLLSIFKNDYKNEKSHFLKNLRNITESNTNNISGSLKLSIYPKFN
jgi:hypothetical protein